MMRRTGVTAFSTVVGCFCALLAGCSSSSGAGISPRADAAGHDGTTRRDGSGSGSSAGKDAAATNDGSARRDAGRDVGVVTDTGMSCEICDAGCSNGLVTMCLVLDPPGCGAQSATQFCPYGCTPQGPESCNFYPYDGAVSSGCIASAVTVQAGTLGAQDAGKPAAVTVFDPSGDTVIVATGAAAACAAEGDAGIAADAGTQAVLVLPTPVGAAGTFGAAGAELTVWKSGAATRQAASGGSIIVNLDQPGAGKIGSYDVTFGSDVEQGTFIAPACDVCSAGK